MKGPILASVLALTLGAGFMTPAPAHAEGRNSYRNGRNGGDSYHGGSNRGGNYRGGYGYNRGHGYYNKGYRGGYGYYGRPYSYRPYYRPNYYAAPYYYGYSPYYNAPPAPYVAPGFSIYLNF